MPRKSKIAYFVRMIARKGKFEEAREDAAANPAAAGEEEGRVVFALYR